VRVLSLKVVSVRVNEDLITEINSVMWWDHLNKSDSLRKLLEIGIRGWKRQKGLNPDIRLEIK